MAITLDNLVSDGNIEVIIRSDTALDVTDEEYDEYCKTLDEAKLRFRQGDEPTRWVMKKKLTYRQKQHIDNTKISIEKGGGMKISLSYMTEEVRATLVDIKNPESVPADKRLTLKKAGDGLVDETFTAALGDIVGELYAVRNRYLEASKERGSADVKKS